LNQAVPISALKGQALDQLLIRIDEALYQTMPSVRVKLPYSAGDLLAVFHQQGSVDQIQHSVDGIQVKGRLPGRLVASFRRYLIAEDEGKGLPTEQLTEE
jgi:GTP-binding protein HflX